MPGCSWDTKPWSFVSECEQKKKRIGLSLWLKMGDPYLLHIGGPKSPPQASQCDSYTALRQTEHPGVFILYVEASRFVAEVIGQKQSLVLNWFYIKGGMWCSCTAMWYRSARGFFFCSFLVLKIGSNIQKGQQCGMCALLEEVDIFNGIFVLIGERRLWNRFLTVQIFLRPQGTVDANCLGCSVPLRLEGNHRLFTPQFSLRARGICSGPLTISIPEITHLSHQAQVLLKKMGWNCG